MFINLLLWAIFITYLLMSFSLLVTGWLTLRGPETIWESIQTSFGWPIGLFLIIKDIFLGR